MGQSFTKVIVSVRRRVVVSDWDSPLSGCLMPNRTLEKAMAPHSSTLAWKIPWMEKPGRLQSMGSLRVGHDWATSLSLFTFLHWRRKWQPTPVFLPGESHGEPGGLLSMGSHRVGHDWSDLAAAAATEHYQNAFHPLLLRGCSRAGYFGLIIVSWTINWAHWVESVWCHWQV